MDHWRKTKGTRILMAEALRNPLLIEPGTIFIINLGKGKGHTNTSHSANEVGVFALERKIESISGGFIKYN
jgi:hypothetical protein